MTNDCKTCPVSTGTHKPAEAVHQIDEPQAEALRLAAELVEPIDGFQEPTMLEAAAAAELHRLHARITELESQLEAIGAGGVEPLRKPTPAPQAVQAAVPEGWKWMSIPSRCGGAIMPVRVFEEDGVKYYQPFDWENETAFKWDKRSKDWVEHEVSGPAHPAEGVPAQVHSALTDARAVLLSINRGDSHRVKVGDDVCYWQRDEWVQWAINEVLPMVDAALAATHPTQQGMADLRWQIVHDHIGGEYIAGRACFVVQIPALPGANIMRGSVAEHFTKAVDAIAAQAKQGGV